MSWLRLQHHSAGFEVEVDTTATAIQHHEKHQGSSITNSTPDHHTTLAPPRHQYHQFTTRAIERQAS
jgi:hypothetical protein